MTDIEHNYLNDGGGWSNNYGGGDKIDDEDLANNSAKLFERSRIKALAGMLCGIDIILLFCL